MLSESQQIQLKVLRTAYRLAKNDDERRKVAERAELVKNPLPYQESTELLQNVKSSVLSLPDYSHPHWNNLSKRKAGL